MRSLVDRSQWLTQCVAYLTAEATASRHRVTSQPSFLSQGHSKIRGRGQNQRQTPFLHRPIGVKQGATFAFPSSHLASLCFPSVFRTCARKFFNNVAGRLCLQLPSSTQVMMMECGRVSILGGSVRRGKNTQYATLQHPAAQRRSLCILKPERTDTIPSKRKRRPHGSPAQMHPWH